MTADVASAILPVMAASAVTAAPVAAYSSSTSAVTSAMGAALDPTIVTSPTTDITTFPHPGVDLAIDGKALDGSAGVASGTASDSRPAVAARKRRRRAPATGATEDCFTCRRRKTKCDRRRPYCSQCIELGKDCSGYRTTLTWGVGVASRGKLRGLSLPVARSQQETAAAAAAASATASALATSPRNVTSRSAATAPSSPAAIRGDYKRKMMSAPRSAVSKSLDLTSITLPLKAVGPATACVDTFRAATASPSPMINSPGPTSGGYDFVHANLTSPGLMGMLSPGTPPPSAPSWHTQGYYDHLQEYVASPGKINRLAQLNPRPLQRIQTSLTSPSYDDTWSVTSGTLSSYGDHSDYSSPINFPQTPTDDISYVEPFFSPYESPAYVSQSSAASLSASPTMLTASNLAYNSSQQSAPRSFPCLTGDELGSTVDDATGDYYNTSGLTSADTMSNVGAIAATVASYPTIYYHQAAELNHAAVHAVGHQQASINYGSYHHHAVSSPAAVADTAITSSAGRIGDAFEDGYGHGNTSSIAVSDYSTNVMSVYLPFKEHSR